MRHAKESKTREFIIGTEIGILHRLKKQKSGKIFLSCIGAGGMSEYETDDAGEGIVALEEMQYEVTVSPDIIRKAKKQSPDNA